MVGICSTPNTTNLRPERVRDGSSWLGARNLSRLWVWFRCGRERCFFEGAFVGVGRLRDARPEPVKNRRSQYGGLQYGMSAFAPWSFYARSGVFLGVVR